MFFGGILVEHWWMEPQNGHLWHHGSKGKGFWSEVEVTGKSILPWEHTLRRTDTWLITMVSPNWGNVGPLPNGRTPWLINRGDPNHLRPSWEPILQVGWGKKKAMPRMLPRHQDDITPPETNISLSPEKWCLEDYVPFEMVPFQVTC